MKITIIQIGKTKDAWLKEGIDEYLKRLTPFANIEVIELADTSIKTMGNPEAVKQKEALTILKRIDRDDYLILLDEKGLQKNSLEFADFLFSISDIRNLVFVIGGVFGVAESVKERADSCLALSKLTFTHRMARLILCEQLYRSMMIKANRSYHL
ncbi:MAG: 23S rRNA (pseudouridine(1915)-N(3))-methyltransferase RlmH [Candidatus Cloacimonas sp.]|nr:23S rRNA (pseudouridine(1915)-N(3))-methyltransferase RlmH [Candidatus Cloacimonas sp.]